MSQTQETAISNEKRLVRRGHPKARIGLRVVTGRRRFGSKNQLLRSATMWSTRMALGAGTMQARIEASTKTPEMMLNTLASLMLLCVHLCTESLRPTLRPMLSTRPTLVVQAIRGQSKNKPRCCAARRARYGCRSSGCALRPNRLWGELECVHAAIA
jgi:hypothetical protein